MALRQLPGAYVTLNDLSFFPEGDTSLTVGYVVKSNKGPVNEAKLVTNPTDFLTKYAFGGAPTLEDDPTMWSILKVLARTNAMYIVRAANEPLYGGATVKKAVKVGTLVSADKASNSLVIEATAAPATDSVFGISGTGVDGVDGYYEVMEVAAKSGQENQYSVIVKRVKTLENQADFVNEVANNYVAPRAVSTTIGKVLAARVVGNYFVIGTTTAPTVDTTFTVADTDKVDGTYTIKEVEEIAEDEYKVVVKETIKVGYDAPKEIVVKGKPIEPLATSIQYPESETLDSNTLMLITGIDQGEYNGKLAFDIISSKDNPSQLAYENTMQLNVRVAATGELLESFVFSRNPLAQAVDGTSLFIDNVLAGSAYIKAYNNANIDENELPYSTVTSQPIQAGAGEDGGDVTEETLTGAIKVFNDKTIPISILGNGCSKEAESQVVQQAMLELADIRKDIVVFLNDPISAESSALPADKAQNIVEYKKGTLGSTSFYGCMYAPHVNTPDSFNNRSVKIGADAVAISGWLNVINNLSYPYAYAGPQNGLVTGVTTDWKIGDESGEAEVLNDASINYIAYDGKVGRYYMQCQNTLQVANSALRNIGGVLNILDIKEHLAAALKEYGQLPITDVLRRDVVNAIRNYLDPMTGTRFYNYAFEDATTAADIAQDTLRYLLYISLTRYANRIICVINVVNSTFDFSIIQSA